MPSRQGALLIRSIGAHCITRQGTRAVGLRKRTRKGLRKLQASAQLGTAHREKLERASPLVTRQRNTTHASRAQQLLSGVEQKVDALGLELSNALL